MIHPCTVKLSGRSSRICDRGWKRIHRRGAIFSDLLWSRFRSIPKKGWSRGHSHSPDPPTLVPEFPNQFLRSELFNRGHEKFIQRTRRSKLEGLYLSNRFFVGHQHQWNWYRSPWEEGHWEFHSSTQLSNQLLILKEAKEANNAYHGEQRGHYRSQCFKDSNKWWQSGLRDPLTAPPGSSTASHWSRATLTKARRWKTTMSEPGTPVKKNISLWHKRYHQLSLQFICCRSHTKQVIMSSGMKSFDCFGHIHVFSLSFMTSCQCICFPVKKLCWTAFPPQSRLFRTECNILYISLTSLQPQCTCSKAWRLVLS